MINRRRLFGASAALTSLVASTLGSRNTMAKLPRFTDVQPRGTIGRMERLHSLALESRQGADPAGRQANSPHSEVGSGPDQLARAGASWR